MNNSVDGWSLKGMHITQSMSHRGNNWKFDTKANTHYPRTKPNFEQEGNDSFGSWADLERSNIYYCQGRAVALF